MTLRRALTAVGAGVATFLLVAVLVIELLYFEFSALIGIPVGILAALAVVAGLWLAFPGMASIPGRVAGAYAAFGFAVLFSFALSYVNVGGEMLSIDVMAGIGIVAGVAVYLMLWADERATAV